MLSVSLCRFSQSLSIVTCKGAEVSLCKLFTFVEGQGRTGPNVQRQTSESSVYSGPCGELALQTLGLGAELGGSFCTVGPVLAFVTG